jgi:hypothetical protein
MDPYSYKHIGEGYKKSMNESCKNPAPMGALIVHRKGSTKTCLIFRDSAQTESYSGSPAGVDQGKTANWLFHKEKAALNSVRNGS